MPNTISVSKYARLSTVFTMQAKTTTLYFYFLTVCLLQTLDMKIMLGNKATVGVEKLTKLLYFAEEQCHTLDVFVNSSFISEDILNIAYTNFYPIKILTKTRLILDLKHYNFLDSKNQEHRHCRLFIFNTLTELNDLVGDKISIYEEYNYGVNSSSDEEGFMKICQRSGGLEMKDHEMKCFEENSAVLKVLVPKTPYLPYIGKNPAFCTANYVVFKRCQHDFF